MDIFDGVAFPGSVEEDLEENEIYNKILIGVLKLQTAYPEYDMRNLLNRIASDGNYERYLDFESEITEFVENLPEYKANENNPAEEMMFGDPQRIELKSLLREYKTLYPDMSYEEIYKKYLSDCENTTGNSREIKLYRLAIDRSSGELSKAKEAQNQQNATENNENQQKETKRNTGGIIAAGAVIIVLAAVIWRRKKLRKKLLTVGIFILLGSKCG